MKTSKQMLTMLEDIERQADTLSCTTITTPEEADLAIESLADMVKTLAQILLGKFVK